MAISTPMRDLTALSAEAAVLYGPSTNTDCPLALSFADQTPFFAKWKCASPELNRHRFGGMLALRACGAGFCDVLATGAVVAADVCAIVDVAVAVVDVAVVVCAGAG
jgi:hypothetical protein